MFDVRPKMHDGAAATPILPGALPSSRSASHEVLLFGGVFVQGHPVPGGPKAPPLAGCLQVPAVCISRMPESQSQPSSPGYAHQIVRLGKTA